MSKIKEKLLNFVDDKSNWIFILFTIPLMTILHYNHVPNNDVWFILNIGRYITNNGFPYVDPFVLHEGFSLVVQQWLSSFIYWNIYYRLGKYGLLLFLLFFSMLLIFIYYKLCYVVSENKYYSVILTTICMTFISTYIIHRPQTFTFAILILELLLLELYVKKKKTIYLYFLPILSMLLSNLHSSMWHFQFVFMLPFIVNAIYIKNITIDRYKLMPILIALFFMIGFGFINPYSYGAIKYVFNSYGIKEINLLVNEMFEVTFKYWQMYGILLSIFGLLCFLNFFRSQKLDVRHFLFICGMIILGLMHRKTFALYLIIFCYVFAYGMKGFKIDIPFLSKKIIKIILNIGKIIICALLYVGFFCYAFNAVVNFQFHKNTSIESTVQYILDHYDTEDIVLYTSYNNGGYAEYMGLKPYIDERAEVFLKKNNKKEDVFIEYYNFVKYKQYDKLTKKYNFTHIITEDAYFCDYLNDSGNYTLVYLDYWDELTNNYAFTNLYVRNDLVEEKEEEIQ